MGKSSTNGDDGVRRNTDPKRSERRWWKKGYSGWYQPPQEYFNNLERFKNNLRGVKNE